MPAKKVIDGYHVEIEPKRLGDLGCVSMSDQLIEPDVKRRVQEYKKRCEDIIRQVKRHIDYIGYAQLIEESHLECEFCGYKWGEDPDSPHNGGCCDKDIEIMDKFNGENNADQSTKR